ncbi:aldehyde dehydrogenase (NAD+) [Hydrogenophaga palleronii]|uniref:Aldehyde dehydrogenase n=1 Tax=Hydrogenophaga palleronii TaxID=65655 RepID=A0ABU1WRB2_9BURK|nr:aldehyde dehydrogenase family protein [Hydrogenophaga palleronii]MDR7151835.1 aldehyde dehydrogenase (NAD+) [Hydrogenophaga palleronii]
MPPIDDADPKILLRLFEQQAPTALALRSSTARERVGKLKRLRDGLLSRREAWYTAFAADLRKPPLEVDLTELLPVVDEARHAIAHLARWMRPQQVRPTLTTLGTHARVLAQPRGRCLIIGPWNYPVNTLLGPLVSAIAAGNTVILKPSEFTPHVNALVAELVAELFDPAEITLVQGGVATAQQLLTLPFDHVFFTGSTAVGRLVMEAAARHLTSVTLELGGKSPVIVDQSADLRQAAELILWGKFTNAGQTCVAPDHVYVHRSVKAEFIRLCQELMAERYGANDASVEASPDLARMISPRHTERLGALIDDALARGATLVAGGRHDSAARYVAPTLLTDVPAEARIGSEEIFGPVLPIEAFDVIDQVIQRINAQPKPLALYLFSRSRSTQARVTAQTSSGGLCLNHCVQQYVHGGLPFGGVNHSGIGSAHGHYGFKAFSHERACLASGPLMPLSLFFPPYTRRTSWLSASLLRVLRWI